MTVTVTVTVTVTMTITVILEGREEEKRASKQANLRRVRGCEGASVLMRESSA